MKKTTMAAAAALSMLALPVALADAKPGHGERHGQGAHGAPEHAAGHGGRADDTRQATPTDDQSTAGETPAEQPAGGRHANRRCKRTQAVGFVAKGSLASFAPESVTLEVKRANRHARAYITAAGSTFTLGSARVRFSGVTDADGNGAVEFADVLATDKVVAIGKATRPKRGCTGKTTLELRKLQIVRPEVEESDDSDSDSDES